MKTAITMGTLKEVEAGAEKVKEEEAVVVCTNQTSQQMVQIVKALAVLEISQQVSKKLKTSSQKLILDLQMQMDQRILELSKNSLI